MSAFIVDPAHIDVMLSTAINGPTDNHRSPGSIWDPPYVNELLEDSATGPLTAAAAD
jgi:hypothetical protein